jgi:hypothetical protein
MRKQLGLNLLRFKKLKELISVTLCYGTKWFSFNKVNEIRYGKNIFGYIFKPKFIDGLEFCVNNLMSSYKLDDTKQNYTLNQIIDDAYCKSILEEYDLSTMGADFKFNTIRNIFRYSFKSRDYVINHYSNKISLPMITLLKREFADKDVYNLIIPIRIKIQMRLSRIETDVYDFVTREFNLLRASPNHCRSPILLVA